jgi:hypothetical protein
LGEQRWETGKLRIKPKEKQSFPFFQSQAKRDSSERQKAKAVMIILRIQARISKEDWTCSGVILMDSRPSSLPRETVDTSAASFGLAGIEVKIKALFFPHRVGWGINVPYSLFPKNVFLMRTWSKVGSALPNIIFLPLFCQMVSKSLISHL